MRNKDLTTSDIRSRTSESGQAIVFIIGALATAFIFGVLASYLATTSIKKTSYTGQAEAALHAAEAGCRHVLVMDQTKLSDTQDACPNESTACVFEPSVNDDCAFQLGLGEEDPADVCYWIEELGGASNTYIVPNQVNQDETVQIDLSDLSNSTIDVYWCDGDQESCNPVTDTNYPALEAAVIYQSGGEYLLTRYAYDANAAARGNNFTNPAGGGGALSGINFAFSDSIDLPDGTEFIRIKPLYNGGNSTTIGVYAHGGDIPSQGLDIRCRGTVGASTRTVQVTKENPHLSSIFDYVLFSGTDITK